MKELGVRAGVWANRLSGLAQSLGLNPEPRSRMVSQAGSEANGQSSPDAEDMARVRQPIERDEPRSRRQKLRLSQTRVRKPEIKLGPKSLIHKPHIMK